MAIIQEGTILAGIRRRIGNVVIYQWKKRYTHVRYLYSSVRKRLELSHSRLKTIK